jgi:hypothetical protein
MSSSKSSSQKSSSKSPNTNSPKSKSYSNRNVFEHIFRKFGDASSVIISKFINENFGQTMLELDSNDNSRFKYNKKELDVILKQLVNTEAIKTQTYNIAIEDLLELLWEDNGDFDNVEFERGIYILEYCGKHRKFNLKNFQTMSNEILLYWDFINKDLTKKNLCYLIKFIEKIFKQEYIHGSAKEKREVYKIMLNIYKKIFEQCIWVAYENMKMEFQYDNNFVRLLKKCFLTKINEIVETLETKDFKDKDIQNSLILEIEFVEGRHNWRNTGEYDGESPPMSQIIKIFFGDENTMAILKSYDQFPKIYYNLNDFKFIS